MKSKKTRSGADFVSLERRAWRENHVLDCNASRGFQKFTDEAFRQLRRIYFSRADLATEMKQRSRIIQELQRGQ
jgi:hypothetical protein